MTSAAFLGFTQSGFPIKSRRVGIGIGKTFSRVDVRTIAKPEPERAGTAVCRWRGDFLLRAAAGEMIRLKC